MTRYSPVFAEMLEANDVRAFIYDLEGTILDTEGAWDAAQEKMLARHGRRYDRDGVKHLLTGRSAASATRILLDFHGVDAPLAAVVAERFSMIQAELAAGAPFVAGFQAFHAAVPEWIGTCVATGMTPELFEIVEKPAGISSLFGGRVYQADALGLPSKPAPDLFRHAAAVLGVPPAKCVVFEDAPNGVAAARAAGMRCVALATTHAPDLLGPADLVISGWAELAGLVPVRRSGPGRAA
ncbi:HAD family hydrolase [Actinoplanes derwentensis]|uniref:Haloacid dehalogenase superfamily, subfamily IA, variant 3 with third motif having DD or ED n=1 Tax=Actinoplanes derwentensis TaxID=113562 RepID=A0A1H2DCY3_9ACTN|nr:HAD family phosphatase [Actinoplanes derwentensis]GID89973.1 hydrolase [Actinoplanes derwentensis]SDT80590.1 haloacid dehalogenase superfamily, subfamily IA, variant 3 with third motif having DD or ED [Actinoplanes derwentensis]